jgi:Secretion system C-terminal sorting domain
MKKKLLFLLLPLFLTTASFAQNTIEQQDDKPVAKLISKKNISVYPNPAINFISLSDSEDVKQLIVFNVVGRKMKSFMVSEGEKYNISELPKGMYLIQILDFNNKIITTQRLSKR